MLWDWCTYIQVDCNINIDDITILQRVYRIKLKHLQENDKEKSNNNKGKQVPVKVHLKFSWIRYSMTNAFIYWCTHTLWKATIAKRRGICSIIDNHLMNCFINFIGFYAWLPTEIMKLSEWPLCSWNSHSMWIGMLMTGDSK